ncbi:MAG TPA: hypothetical protein VII73_01015 [Caulobacteraceae bacterium]
MSGIFLSYARSTARQGQAVADALRALGHGLWLDDEEPELRELLLQGIALAEDEQAARASPA